MFDNPAKPLCWNVHAAKSERILAMAEIASVSEYSDVSVWRTRIDRRNDQKVVLTPFAAMSRNMEDRAPIRQSGKVPKKTGGISSF